MGEMRGTPVLAALAAFLVLAVPAGLRAEPTGPGGSSGSNPLKFHAAAGVVLPVGTLSDLERVGPAVDVGASYWLQPRIALRVDGDAGFPEGRNLGYPGVLVDHVPDMMLWHYLGGVEFRLTPPSESLVDVDLNVEAGATTVGTTDAPVFSTNDITNTYPTEAAGLKVDLNLGRSVDLFLDGNADLVNMKSANTAIYSTMSSKVSPSGFGSALSLPVEFGLKFAY